MSMRCDDVTRVRQHAHQPECHVRLPGIGIAIHEQRVGVDTCSEALPFLHCGQEASVVSPAPLALPAATGPCIASRCMWSVHAPSGNAPSNTHHSAAQAQGFLQAASSHAGAHSRVAGIDGGPQRAGARPGAGEQLQHVVNLLRLAQSLQKGTDCSVA